MKCRGAKLSIKPYHGLSLKNLQNACDSVIASFDASSCAGGGRKNCERASERLTVLYLMPKEIQRLFCLIWATSLSAFDPAGPPRPAGSLLAPRLASQLLTWQGHLGQPAGLWSGRALPTT